MPNKQKESKRQRKREKRGGSRRESRPGLLVQRLTVNAPGSAGFLTGWDGGHGTVEKGLMRGGSREAAKAELVALVTEPP